MGVFFASDNQVEVQNASKYIETRTFRFLVRQLKDDGLIAISKYRFSLVPVQDFTDNSDIDWSQSVSEIDKQLYKKYKLTQDEINYIEKTIKSME